MTDDMRTGTEWQTAAGQHIIMGGGQALPGAPESWKWALEWADKANKESDSEIKWSWDCHFKLDYDGEIVSISSRFYPPAKHYGSKWDGAVTLYICNEEVKRSTFECETLEQLRIEVEAYCNKLISKIRRLAQEVLL